MSEPRPEFGQELPDDRMLEAVIGPPLVARIYGLLRAVRLYEVTNQAVRDQLRDALVLIDEAMEDEVTLVAMGQCFYLNGVRVRAETSQIPLFGALSTEFEQRRLGGLRLLQGLEAEELGAFLRLMVEHADAVRGPQLVDAAAGAGVAHVVPITLEELESAERNDSEAAGQDASSEQDGARRVFRQAVQGAKATLLRTAKTGRPAIRRAKRVVQPIVDSIMRNDFSIVGLTALKNYDEYTYTHCVNVSILSVALGQLLGLPRGTLANLGVGGLLHDVGKLTIPIEVLAKPGRLTADEWAMLQRHPLEGVKTLFRMPGLSPLMLDALGVCLYHHVRYEGGGYPKQAVSQPVPPLARIVSVADCYDAMTTHRAYRNRAFTGCEALSTLLGPDRHFFDPAVLWALIRTVGLYPTGTVMQTRSGHVVLSLGNDPSDLRRPRCMVLAHPDGRHAPQGQQEVWAPMPSHEAVARVIPPEEFEREFKIEHLLAA